MKSSFTIYNTTQEFQIVTEEVSASGGADAPTLNIPISFDFTPIRRNSAEEPSGFKLLFIKADLRITDRNFMCSETTHLSADNIFDKRSKRILFSFLLNSEIVNRIEKYRKGNLPLQISIQVQVATYGTAPGVGNSNRTFIAGFEDAFGSISTTIEQSQWVVKILPQLGNNTYKLIELPAFNDLIPELYAKTIIEFEEANKYFINGDYDKTVAHCRAALDPFYLNKEKFKELKDFVKSKSEFEWADKVLTATEEWLDKVIKATSAFSSKAHHAPSVGHFSRVEAEIVLMITTGIVAYIGKIEYKPE